MSPKIKHWDIKHDDDSESVIIPDQNALELIKLGSGVKFYAKK
jgi:hypothetical protein